MRSLFINTSSFFMSIAILENGSVVYKKEEEMLTDMASRIVPEIELAFNNVTFELSDIENALKEVFAGGGGVDKHSPRNLRCSLQEIE